MLLHAFNNLHVFHILSVVSFSPVGRAPYECYLGLMCRLLQGFRTYTYDFNSCLRCDRLAVIYLCFTDVNTFPFSVLLGTGHFDSIHSYQKI